MSTFLNNDQLLEVLSLSKNAIAIYDNNDNNIIIRWANNAMMAFWGKGTEVIGLPLEDALSRLRDQPFKKILQDVFKTGLTYNGESIPVGLHVNGTLQTFYYDFEYRAITNEAGETYCVLHTATDVTAKTLNAQALQKAQELEEIQKKALAESNQNFRLILLQAPVAIAIFRGPQYVVETVNARALELWGRQETAVINRPIFDTMPELIPQGIKKLLDEVYLRGKSFSFTEHPVQLLRNGKPEATYINFLYEPLYDSGGAINGLIIIGNEVTDQVLARRELETARDNLKLSVDAAGLGTFDIDMEKDIMVWDERCRVLFGISHRDKVTYEKDFVAGLHPDDRERIVSLIRDKVMVKSVSNGNYDVEYRTVGAEDGKIRWIKAKGKVYFDKNNAPKRF
ncbi:MAG TPA: PAS domain-containing protein, partial [Mucilaginibacter sp.]